MNRKERRDYLHRLTRLAAVQAMFAFEKSEQVEQTFDLLAASPQCLGFEDDQDCEDLDLRQQVVTACYDGVELARQAWEQKELIDQLLRELLNQDWTLDRLNAALRAVLRFALWEWKTERLGLSIVANEAIEVARAMSDEDGAKFVAAVMGTLGDRYDSPK